MKALESVTLETHQTPEAHESFTLQAHERMILEAHESITLKAHTRNTSNTRGT